MGRETSDLSPSYSFITPDGTLWNACFNQVRRFQNGRWESVQQVPERNAPSFHVKPANSDGPPWLLLDDFRHELWRLDHGAKRENPRLSRVEIREDGKALAIASAIPWSEGTLLLATRVGMRAYARATGMLSRVNLAEPPQPATVLVRDGLGRLWWGNHNGLGLSEPGDHPRKSSIACRGLAAAGSMLLPPIHSTPTASSRPSAREAWRSCGHIKNPDCGFWQVAAELASAYEMSPCHFDGGACRAASLDQRKSESDNELQSIKTDRHASCFQ